MDCRRFDAVFFGKAVEIGTRVFVCLVVCMAIVGAAFAQPPSPKTRDVLRQAYDYQLQFRSGNRDIVPEYVALLEDATKNEPNDADLWYAMGVAYLAQAARAMMLGGNPPDAMTALQKGPAALRRALQIDPDHAGALAQLGGVQAMMGSFMQAPAMAARGVAQMNRAVELAPQLKRARLQRAFSGLSLPDALRDHATEAEDLEFLSAAAEGSRAGDYVRLMRGDLAFETGKADEARTLYQAVGKSMSPAAVEAKARLSALDLGGVAMSDIRTLRAAAGANCAMCHGG